MAETQPQPQPHPGDKLPWWVSLIVFPIIAGIELYVPEHVKGQMGTTLGLVDAGAAWFIGLHTEVPAWLTHRPIYAKFMALVSGGLLVNAVAYLPMITDPRFQSLAWIVIAFAAYLAGKPMTVMKGGKALPSFLTKTLDDGSLAPAQPPAPPPAV